ncbi:MAG: phosphomannomutase/phosphoglucomutase [Spirochaetaceae bacterium]|nr:phosphomannomutase/phosphoglucomutase [Spirochaetaceae bacterium]
MSVFKANDIRGRYPEEWNKDTAYRIGRCLPDILSGEQIVIGRDARSSSEEILEYLTKGLLHRGIQITDIGMVDTPAVYFAVGKYGFDAGIMITASHNPPGYNGIKLTGKNVVPIDSQSGLEDLAQEVLSSRSVDRPNGRESSGGHGTFDISRDYLLYLGSFRGKVPGIKAVFDCSSGMAGRFIHQILNDMPGEFIVVNDEIDGTFPVHGPNPSLPENLRQVRELVLSEKADIGFCFDGDGDRVVMIDADGEVVSPDLLTAILGLYYFKYHPEKTEGNKTVLVDIRSSNSVAEFLENLGAEPMESPVGHAKIKRLMRKVDALFGGELTGHYYFKENFYSDSPWLTIFRVLSVLAEGDENLAQLRARIMKYHFSGELNFPVKNQDEIVDGLLREYADGKLNRIEGLRVDYPDWWFIVRKSSTEPYLRLVVETKIREELALRTNELTEAIERLESLNET